MYSQENDAVIVYDKPDCVQVVHHPGENIIVLTWTSFMITLEEIKDLHRKTLDAALQKQCFYFVAETSRVRNAFRQEVIEWWGREWVPELVAAKLRAIVTVVPTRALAQLSTNSWQAEVVGPITMKNVKTLDEARAFVRELRLKAPPAP